LRRRLPISPARPKQSAVSVAIECNAKISILFHHFGLQRFRVSEPDSRFMLRPSGVLLMTATFAPNR